MKQDNIFFDEALEFIKNNDLNALPVGKNIINGDNLYVNIIEGNLKTVAEAEFEVHKEYIDIQIPLSAAESYGVKPFAECTTPDGGYVEATDTTFYSDAIQTIVSRQPGEMIVFYPDTAHAPMIGEGRIKKAIFKVRVQ